MKKNIQQFLFGSSFTTHNPSQFIWLLFRLHIGLSMAIEAGFGKVKDITPPEWFVKQVGDLGFTFISPTFWAFLSSWGEFLGGLFIAVGFLTRFSAIQLAFQFFVISFIWYDKPQPITGMYIQQIYLWCYVLVAGFGGGKFSIDYLIMNKKATKTNYANMPKMAILLILFCTSVFTSQAQMGPLNGSGIVVNKTFDFNNFDKISFDDLDGKIEIEIGKPYAISINIDDNLDELLSVNQINGELQVKLLNNKNNKLYIENTNIKITISLPQLLQVSHAGNSTMKVRNISGNIFKFKSAGNGNTILSGTINLVEFKKSGNGNINAINLVTNSANITKTGNGDIELHSNNNFNFSSTGNGNIINYGEGLAVVNGVKSGNGRIINKTN